MASATPSAWAHGLKPMPINPLPKSFVTFFPMNDTVNRPATTEDEYTPGSKPLNLTWASHLAVPRSVFRKPIWSRVARKHSGAKDTTMKRVNRALRQTTLAEKTEPNATASPLEAEDGHRAQRPRLGEYVETDLGPDASEIVVSAWSIAEVQRAQMEARVAVANSLLANPSGSTLQEIKAQQSGHQHKTVPQKRRVCMDGESDYDELNAGNRLITYSQVLPILAKAIRKGLCQIDLQTACSALSSATLQDIRSDPRKYLAAHGEPDLSVIADVTEPEISQYTIEPPIDTVEAYSPIKRDAQPSSPLASVTHRITDNKIELAPTSSPPAEPSPTKSDSGSPTPRPSKTFAVPDSTLSPSSSKGLATDAYESAIPREQQIEASSPVSDRFWEATDFNSPIGAAQQDMSPVKYSRPVAPTPSKWNRHEPSTPSFATPRMKPFSAYASPLGLMAAIPEGTPRPPPSPAMNPVSEDSFMFGNKSPFNSPSWVDNTIEEHSTPRLLGAKRRRESEPLVRTLYRTQKKRLSVSPRKLVSRNEVSTPTTAATELSASLVANTQPEINLNTPVSQSVTATTPLIQVSPAQGELGPAAHNSCQDVLNIDMRENPDIFGPPNPNHTMTHLASLVNSNCDGLAKVEVQRENGRLVVRFKMPAEYGAYFPESQGIDESRFTTSPSAVSSSPLARLFAPQQLTQSQLMDSSPTRQQSPARLTVDNLSADLLPKNSPQAPQSSPVKRSTAARSPGSALWNAQQDMDPTLVVSDFANSSPPPPYSADRDHTLVVSDFDQSTPKHAVHTSPALEDSLDTLLQTPSGGLGIVLRDTPEEFRHSVIFAETPSMFPDTASDFRHSEARFSTPSAQSPRKMAPTSASPGLSLFNTPLTSGAVARDTPEDRRFSPYQPSYSDLMPEMRRASRRTPLSRQRGPSRLSNSFTAGASAEATPTIAAQLVQAEGSLETYEQTPRQEAASVSPPAGQVTPTGTPVLNTSFTPVNQTPRQSFTSPARTEETTPIPLVTDNKTVVRDDEDDFNRAHLLDFLKRSNSKRLSTTDAGSPIIAPTKREPLVAKSVNIDTPEKAKRKLEQIEHVSPAKDKLEPAPKRARTTRGRKPKVEEPKKADIPAEAVAEDEQEDADDAQSTRRSKRIRGLGNSVESRSSIPTPIKINRPGLGNNGQNPVLNAAVRTEQQELTHQTRMNTRRNKGAAEYPATVLARRSEELSGSDQESTEPVSKAKGGKAVVWREPLESYQTEKKKGKTAAKSTAKNTSGIAKPKKAPTPRQRGEKLAQGLDRPESGTPARPQRMTRSRTRGQQ